MDTLLKISTAASIFPPIPLYSHPEISFDKQWAE